MDLVLKGRGVHITDKIRHVVEHKLSRFDGKRRPVVQRLDVQIIGEHNPRIGESHRVEVACQTAHHTFHAHGAGSDVDVALDRVVERLQRQISDYRSKRTPRKTGKTTPTTPPES